ncbi:hypothetical protein ACHABX_06275 [Nesterenkonia halotolerans]|uniref:hypothetical protein n=1 Tax=Nesterenkonia halotolerans TaxID=225325 RepID=UPI003EE55678
MVAPPTSGQSHEVESNFSDPFSSQDSDAGSAGSASGSTPESALGASRVASQAGTTGKSVTSAAANAGNSDAQKPALSPHEQWILSQRPPHW